MDGCMQPDPRIKRDPAEGPLASMLAYMRVKSHLYRWRMNMRTGETSEESLDDLNVEFCLPDVDLYGQKTRYSYHQHIPLEAKTLIFTDLVKYDHDLCSAGHRVWPDCKRESAQPLWPRIPCNMGSGRTHLGLSSPSCIVVALCIDR